MNNKISEILIKYKNENISQYYVQYFVFLFSTETLIIYILIYLKSYLQLI